MPDGLEDQYPFTHQRDDTPAQRTRTGDTAIRFTPPKTPSRFPIYRLLKVPIPIFPCGSGVGNDSAVSYPPTWVDGCTLDNPCSVERIAGCHC